MGGPVGEHTQIAAVAKPSRAVQTLCLVVAVALPGALAWRSSVAARPLRSTERQAPPKGVVASPAEVALQCGGACHPVPPPDILPKAAWRDELVRMMLIREGAPVPEGASNFIPVPREWLPVLRYYEANAPARLPDPEPWPAVSMKPLAFERRTHAAPEGSGAIAVAHVRLLDLDGDKRLDIVASNMRAGAVLAGLARDGFAMRPIATLKHPAHIEPADLDRDGLEDLLVADLGSFLPAEHQQGSVWWLRRSKDGTYTPIVLAKGLARTADARVADFDGDQDLDVVVGVFGWRQTGNVTLLENRTSTWQAPVFEPRVLDSRTGAIHVPVVDLNKDGRPDFLTLFAQQHESVVAFINRGQGLAFSPQTLYAAPHPNWGSSGIEPVDLDRDGDLDVLLTHGDTFDDFVLKPYHGIQWLENRGTQPFTPHSLATLPGAQRAQAADLDGDGDLDIVASALIAGGEANPGLASLVWLEQTSPRVFERRTIEIGSPFHATLDVGDVDGDGDPDIAVGWFALDTGIGSSVDIWRTSRP